MDALHEYRYTPEKLGFYIAASDQDMLSQISRIMNRSGYVGVMDTAGRVHYLVDGRRGSPFASRRIIETTGRILRDHIEAGDPLRANLMRFIDPVLARHNIRPELKGYQYMRYLLLTVGLDETMLRPISKTLYPAVASHYQVNIAQIERDIRYSLQETDLHRHGLTTTAAIIRMYQELVRLAETASDAPGPGHTEQDEQNVVYTIGTEDMEKPSVNLVSDGGHLPDISDLP